MIIIMYSDWFTYVEDFINIYLKYILIVLYYNKLSSEI